MGRAARVAPGAPVLAGRNAPVPEPGWPLTSGLSSTAVSPLRPCPPFGGRGCPRLLPPVSPGVAGPESRALGLLPRLRGALPEAAGAIPDGLRGAWR